MLEVGTSGSDRRDPNVRRVAFRQIEVVQIWTSGGDCFDAGVRHVTGPCKDGGVSAGEPAHQPGEPGVVDGAQAAAESPHKVDGVFPHEALADAKPPFAHPRDHHHLRPSVTVAEHRHQHLVGQHRVERHGDGSVRAIADATAVRTF